MTERQTNQEIIATIPKDSIQLINNYFIGQSYFIKKEDKTTTIYREDFNSAKTNPLPDFFYNKPTVESNQDPFDRNNISISRESSPRSGYYLIKIVNDVRRSPNHLYEDDNGIICAVYKDNKWETRYFSQQSLDLTFWNLVTK